ncbi:MAG: hypothetical protein EOO88_23340, partial [Pedobacter sp.]
MNDKEERNSGKLDLTRLNTVLKADKTANLPSKSSVAFTKTVLILSQHRFYRHLVVELAEAEVAQNGKLKNPIRFIDPLDMVWKTDKQEELKFYTGVSRFKNNYSESRATSDLEALKAIVRNPLHMEVYLHDEKIASSITASSIVPAKMESLKPELILAVNERADHFEVSGKLFLEDHAYGLE